MNSTRCKAAQVAAVALTLAGLCAGQDDVFLIDDFEGPPKPWRHYHCGKIRAETVTVERGAAGSCLKFVAPESYGGSAAVYLRFKPTGRPALNTLEFRIRAVNMPRMTADVGLPDGTRWQTYFPVSPTWQTVRINVQDLKYGGQNKKPLADPRLACCDLSRVGEVRVFFWGSMVLEGKDAVFFLDDVRLVHDPKVTAPGVETFNVRAPTPWRFDSRTRRSICLNGTWRFHPFVDHDANTRYTQLDIPVAGTDYPRDRTPQPKLRDAVPAGLTWEKIRVPGSWYTRCWYFWPDEFGYPEEWRYAHRAFYERDVHVPADWQGRRVVVRFEQVVWLARLFVNGHRVGDHRGGAGPFEMDITSRVNFGQTNRLDVLVGDLSVKPAELNAAKSWWTNGITQDVTLLSRPEVAVQDVFVISSFRSKQVTARVTLRNDGASSASVDVAGAVLKPDGAKLLDMPTKRVTVRQGKTLAADLTAGWPKPRLWLPHDPQLCLMRIDLRRGEELVDQSAARFGFKEVWNDGRRMLVNGIETRLRMGDLCEQWRMGSTRPEYLRLVYKAFREVHVNCVRTGWYIAPKICYEVGDEEGMLFIPDGSFDAVNFKGEASIKQTAQDYRDWMTSVRNHPSILLWSIGNEKWNCCQVPEGERFEFLVRLYQTMNAADPTRPTVICGAAAMGQTAQAYFAAQDMAGVLDWSSWHYPFVEKSFQPLIDIFGAWAEKCNKPLLCSEYSPFASVPRRWVGDECVTRPIWHPPAGMVEAARRINMLDTQIRQTLMSKWLQKVRAEATRTYGVNGIYVFPLNHTRFLLSRSGRADWLPFNDYELRWPEPSAPGIKPKYFLCWGRYPVDPYAPDGPSYRLHPLEAGITKLYYQPLLLTLSRGLAHNFQAGETVVKSAHVVNDTPQPMDRAELRWRVQLGHGRDVAGAQTRLDIRAGGIDERTMTFTVPSVRRPVEATLQAELWRRGECVAEDNQVLTFVPKSYAARPNLGSARFGLYDPRGETAALLAAAGVKAKKVAMGSPADLRGLDVLVVGRQCLDKKALALADAIDAFASAGGRVLVFEQRTNHRLPRSFAFVPPQAKSHPVFDRVDTSLLYLWRGGDVWGEIAATRYSFPDKGLGRCLAYTNWEYAFRNDLGKGPVLLEMGHGQGYYLLNNLEVTARYGADPVPTRLAHNLLAYVAKPRPEGFDAPGLPKGCLSYLVGLGGQRYEPKRQPNRRARRRFVPLDISQAANMGLADEVAEDRKGGWTDQGLDDMRNFPTGDWVLADVWFRILDPSKNQGKAIVVLKGSPASKRTYFPKQVRVPVGKKLRGLCFCHSSAWTPKKKTLVMEYVVNYADRTSVRVPVFAGTDIADWWHPFAHKKLKARVAWAGDNQVTNRGENVVTNSRGAYAMRWVNPAPAKVISSIDLVSHESAVPVVIAISGRR